MGGVRGVSGVCVLSGVCGTGGVSGVSGVGDYWKYFIMWAHGSVCGRRS